MSDLVGDADDLIVSIQKSPDPRVQALKATVEALIEDIREIARERIGEAGDDSSVSVASRVTIGIGLTVAIVVSGFMVSRALRASRKANPRR